jgi:hypothetical protein
VLSLALMQQQMMMMMTMKKKKMKEMDSASKPSGARAEGGPCWSCAWTADGPWGG